MKQLDPSTYEHPTDRTALMALKKVPLLDTVATWVLNFLIKTDYLVLYRGNAIEVTEKTLPRVHNLKSIAAERLCLNMDVPMFVTLEWEYNAFAAGVDHPIIVLNSGLVENFTDEELLSIIGHEMGHIKSRHMLYHWMADNLSKWMYSTSIISGPALYGLIIAMKEWQRKSELTADRAGLIANNDNKDAAIMAQMKLMGLPDNYNTSPDWNFTVEDILEQAQDQKEFKEDSFYKKRIYAIATGPIDHPWSAERIREMREWQMQLHYTES